MKNLKITICAAIALVATLTANECAAQNLGGWSAGAKVNIYSGWDGAAGVGFYGRYGIGAGFRVEPSVVFLCRKGMSVDISADLHYPINLTRDIEAYPLVGLSFNDPGNFGLGVGFGGGLGYKITNRVSLDFGAKWVAQTQKMTKNPVVFSLGGGYRF